MTEIALEQWAPVMPIRDKLSLIGTRITDAYPESTFWVSGECRAFPRIEKLAAQAITCNRKKNGKLSRTVRN
jgi:hypothetical protein